MKTTGKSSNRIPFSLLLRLLLRLLLLFLLLPLAAAFTENIVLDGVTIIHGNGEITTGGRVVIKGDRIQYAGPAAASPEIPNAEIHDLSFCFVLPGLIDSDVHLDAYPYIDQWVSSGITTIVDVGASLAASYLYREKTIYFRGIFTNITNRWNQSYGPDVLISGKMITVPEGFPFGYIGFDIATAVNGVEEAGKAARELVDAGVDFIRIIIDERLGRNPDNPTLTAAEVRTIVQTVHKHNLPVMAHVDTVDDVRKAVNGGVDILLHTSNEILPGELIEQIVQNNIPIIPSVELTDRFKSYAPLSIAKNYQEAVYSNLKALVEAGATLLYGSDFPNGQFGLSHRELQAWIDAGLSPHDIIQSLTSRPAAFWGLEDRGVVEAGRLADLVIFSDSPMKDIDHLLSPRYVMKRGRFVRRPPLEIESAFAHYQFSEIASDPEWNIEDKIHYDNTRLRIAPFYGFSSLNRNFTLGGFVKLLFPESSLHPTLQLNSGVNFPDKVFSGEIALSNRFDLNNEIALKGGILGKESYFAALSSRHKLGPVSFWPELNFRDTHSDIEWLRTETAVDLGLEFNFFYQDLYPFLFRRGVLTWALFGGYNLTRNSPFASTVIENHTVLGYKIHEFILDTTFGLATPGAPLNRMMNLRETASFDNDARVGDLKLFGGLGYQIRLLDLLAGMFEFKLGTLAQMGFLYPALESFDLQSSDYFFGETILFGSFQLFYVFEIRLGAALDFQAWKPFDLSRSVTYLSIHLLHLY